MKSKITKLIIVILIIIFVGLVGGYIAFSHYYDKMDTPEDDGSIENEVSEPIETELEQVVSSVEMEPDKNTISELDQSIAQMEKEKEPIPFEDNLLNILLIGSDSRDEENDRGRSDSMMLLTINKETEEIFLTSFMRDMYVSIPGKGNNRINAAYAYGGADLLMDTIEENFRIPVDKYIEIGFDTFMDVIDSCGGISGIPMTEEELECMNGYMHEINKLHGLDLKDGYHDGKPDADGTYSLTGKQALSYSRIRYVSNGEESNDFGRTARQRTVILALYDKIKDLNMLELNKLLLDILPNVKTNIEKGEFFSLLLDCGKYISYDITESRIPIDGSYDALKVNRMSVIGVDFNKNIEYLHNMLYKNSIQE